MTDNRHPLRGHRLLVPVLALLSIALIAGAGRASRAHAAGPITLQEVISSGLTHPVAFASAGDSRLFIAEQGGRIRIFNGSTLLPTPFLDISALISTDDERGLLGMAMHPTYQTTSPYIYIYYTNPAGTIILARYHVSSGNPNIADPGSATIMLTIPHPANSNHNGGQLAFGWDGKLYVGVGDGGGTGDPDNNAQNLTTLLGKVLRLDVDMPPTYIPPNNPFVSTPGARGEIWARGFRNPWRFSFDRGTGDLFIGDVGQELWEEVDFQTAGSSGGQNYGWRVMEGAHCYNPVSCNPVGYTPPMLEYGHGDGDCAVIGGPRYRGFNNALWGTYFYGDFCTGKIWGATLGANNVWTPDAPLDTALFISSFGEDNRGEVYVSDWVTGKIYKIIGPASVGGSAELPSLTAQPGDSCLADSALAAIAAAFCLIAVAVIWRVKRAH